jgi:hypothetical protein
MLTLTKQEYLGLENRAVWIPGSPTPNGAAEVPLAGMNNATMPPVIPPVGLPLAIVSILTTFGG